MTILAERAWLNAGRLGARAPGCRKCACQEPTLGRSILPMPTTVGWGRQVFLTGNNRQYFSCKAVIGFAGRASVAGSKIPPLFLPSPKKGFFTKTPPKANNCRRPSFSPYLHKH